MGQDQSSPEVTEWGASASSPDAKYNRTKSQKVSLSSLEKSSPVKDVSNLQKLSSESPEMINNFKENFIEQYLSQMLF